MLTLFTALSAINTHRTHGYDLQHDAWICHRDRMFLVYAHDAATQLDYYSVCRAMY